MSVSVSVPVGVPREKRRVDAVHNTVNQPHPPMPATAHHANVHPIPHLAEPEHAVCVSCGGDTDAPDGLSRCCGSQVTYPGPENDDKRSLAWL